MTGKMADYLPDHFLKYSCEYSPQKHSNVPENPYHKIEYPESTFFYARISKTNIELMFPRSGAPKIEDYASKNVHRESKCSHEIYALYKGHSKVSKKTSVFE